MSQVLKTFRCLPVHIATSLLSCVHEQKAYGLHTLCIEYSLLIGVATVANKKEAQLVQTTCTHENTHSIKHDQLATFMRYTQVYRDTITL